MPCGIEDQARRRERGELFGLGGPEDPRLPEALKGERFGQRSIRLSIAYRAIYEIKRDGRVEFVSIEEVSKHEY